MKSIYNTVDYTRYSDFINFVEANCLEYLRLLETIVFRREELRNNLELVINEIEQRKNRKLNLVVAGEFSRGKSTFINALIKTNLLCVSVEPTTAKICTLEYSDCEEIIGVKQDSTQFEIPAGELASYLTESGDKKKEIKEIIIRIKSPFLSKGFNLIDTPGTNVNLEDHLKITKNILNSSDAIIFLLNADHPVTKSEISFIKENCHNYSNIFWVLNKIDLVDEEERNDVIEDTKIKISKLLNLKIEKLCFFPVSSKLYLNNLIKKIDDSQGFDLLENGLMDFGGFLKDKLALEKIIKFISKEVNAFYEELDQIFNPIRQKVSEIEIKLAEINRKLEANIVPQCANIIEKEISGLPQIPSIDTFVSGSLNSIQSQMINGASVIRKSQAPEALISSIIQEVTSPVINKIEMQLSQKVDNASAKVDKIIRDALNEISNVGSHFSFNTNVNFYVSRSAISSAQNVNFQASGALGVVAYRMSGGNVMAGVAVALGSALVQGIINALKTDADYVMETFEKIKPQLESNIRSNYSNLYYNYYGAKEILIEKTNKTISKIIYDLEYNRRLEEKKRIREVNRIQKLNRDFEASLNDIRIIQDYLNNLSDVLTKIDDLSSDQIVSYKDNFVIDRSILEKKISDNNFINYLKTKLIYKLTGSLFLARYRLAFTYVLLFFLLISGYGFYEYQNETIYNELIDKAAAAVKNNDYKSAVDIYEAALKIYSNKPDVLFQIARLSYLNNDFDKASEHFNRVINAKYRVSDANYYKGIIYLYRKNKEAALSYFENFINSDPKAEFLNEVQGHINYYNKNYDQAAKYYKGINANSSCWAFINRGKIKLSKNDFNGAKSDLNKGNSIGPVNGIADEELKIFDRNLIQYYKKFGNDLYTGQKYDDAINYYKKILEIDPNHADALFNIAACEFCRKNYNESIEYYNKTLKVNPNDAEAYLGIADCEKALKNFYAALKHYKKSSELSGEENETVKTEIINIKKLLESAYKLKKEGNKNLLENKFDEAIACYNKANDIFSGDNEVYRNLAKACIFKQNFSYAIMYCEKALKIDKDDSYAYSTKAAAEFNMKIYSKAIEDYEMAIKYRPDEAVLFINLAKTKLAIEKYNEAIADCQNALKIEPQNQKALELLDTIQKSIKN